MSEEELDRLEQDALRTLRIKSENARKGNDWVVDAHTLTSCKLIELVSLAKRGWPIWKAEKQ